MNGFFLLIPFFLIRFALLFFFIIITRRPLFRKGGNFPASHFRRRVV